MDDREKRHRAAEALRLINEPLLIEALEAIRLNTLVDLSQVDATQIHQVMKLQAKAAVTYEIILELQAIIVAAPAETPAEKRQGPKPQSRGGDGN